MKPIVIELKEDSKNAIKEKPKRRRRKRKNEGEGILLDVIALTQVTDLVGGSMSRSKSLFIEAKQSITSQVEVEVPSFP